MKIINQDITTIKDGIIAHQVNILGSMNSGVGAQLKKLYPSMFRGYKVFLEEDDSLGNISFHRINGYLTIACLYSQGTIYEEVNTDYDALKQCIIGLNEYASALGKQVYLPYKMEGGNWDIIFDIFSEYIPEAILCRI
jgi:hypothetical protein